MTAGDAPGSRDGLRRWLALAAVVAAGVLMARARIRFDRYEPAGAYPAVVAAIVLGGLAARLAPVKAKALLAPPGSPLSRGEKVFLAVVFVAAGALRLVGLETAPPGGFFDEAQNGIVAQSILDGARPVFVAEASQMPALYFYVLAAAVALGGRTVVSVRAVSGLAGAFTLPLFYLLARRFLAKEAAAAATLLLLLSRWHLNFSRIGFNGIFSPLLELLAVLALLKLVETGRLRHGLALGVVVGLGLQLYYAFNVFPVVLVIVAVAAGLRKEEPSFLAVVRRALPGLALSIGVAALLLLPLGHFAWKHPSVFFARSSSVVIWNPEHGVGFREGLRRNLIAHAGMFHYIGDANPRHNIPDAPMLSPIEGALLPLGLGAALLGGGVAGIVSLGWFLVMLLPGILTIEAPQAYRTIGCLPGLFLLLGGALELLSRLVAGPVPRPRRLLTGALLLLAVAIGAHGAVSYFRLQVTSALAWNEFQGVYNAVGRYVARLPAGWAVFVNPVFEGAPSVRLYVGPNTTLKPFRLGDHVPPDPKLSVPGPSGKVFVLDAFENDLVGIFRSAYPHAVVERTLDPVGRIALVAIRVPENGPLPAPGLEARGYRASFYANETFDGAPARVRDDPAVMFHFHWFEDGITQPFSADWMSFLEAPRDGTYRFELFSSGPALLAVDGKKVLSHDAFEYLEPEKGAIELSRGRHTVVVRFLNHSWSSTIRLWWHPPGGRRQVIPLELLTRPTEAEYEALRPSLPKPAERKP